jgi:hypothetical protein
MSRVPTAVRKILLYCRAKEELQERLQCFYFWQMFGFLKFENALFQHIMRIFCEKNGPNFSDFEKIKMKLPDFYNRVPVVKIYIMVLILFYYHIWSIAKIWLNLFVNASLAILREPYSDSVPGSIYDLLRDFATLINLHFQFLFFFFLKF